jgi:hypothetical protein
VGLPGTGLSYVEQTPCNHAPRRWVRWLWIFAIGIAVLWAIAAHSETLRCSTSFQGYRVCSSPSGYRSMEWEKGGRRYGDDNAGNKWTTFDGAGARSRSTGAAGSDLFPYPLDHWPDRNYRLAVLCF